MNEQCRDLIENKGELRKTCRQSWNVIENKGGYVSKAGMSLKRKGLGAGCWGLEIGSPCAGRLPASRARFLPFAPLSRKSADAGHSRPAMAGGIHLDVD
jgi:hypothetical protein